jgi:cyclophilin family peptidyl-prolyl cis-trans isomerase
MMQLPRRLPWSIAAVSLAAVLSQACLPAAPAFAKADTHKMSGKKEKMPAEPVVLLDTTKGPIKIQLFTSDAPVTAGNFLDLVNRGFYNGLTFHRYEPGFVIQGGDPKGTGTGGFIDPDTGRERRIPLEVKKNLRHDAAGVVAMARSSEPDSASSQFYITLAPATFLDMKYAVFGKVIDGLPAVLELRKGDKINSAKVQQ